MLAAKHVREIISFGDWERAERRVLDYKDCKSYKALLAGDKDTKMFAYDLDEEVRKAHLSSQSMYFS